MKEINALIKQTIADFDKDLATMVVFASLGQDVVKLKQMLAVASHMQNGRSIELDIFTNDQLKLIEATNKLLQSQLIDDSGYIN